jgi:hypothetical protein
VRTFPENTQVKYIVTANGGDDDMLAYGPFDSKAVAERWGRVALDDAVVRELRVPKDYDLSEDDFCDEVLYHSGLDKDVLSPKKLHPFLEQAFKDDWTIEDTVGRLFNDGLAKETV